MDDLKLELYWYDIPIGKENAVTYPVLRSWWNLNEREVRRVLHDLSSFDNGDNFILIRSGKNKGFYKTNDEKEIETYRRECLNKGRSIFAPIRKINRVLRVNKTQYSFDNNLRVVREGLNLSQKVVVQKVRAVDPAFDVPMLSKMENGVCLPTPMQLNMLSQIYRCEPRDLVNIDIFC